MLTFPEDSQRCTGGGGRVEFSRDTSEQSIRDTGPTCETVHVGAYRWQTQYKPPMHHVSSEFVEKVQSNHQRIAMHLSFLNYF